MHKLTTHKSRTHKLTMRRREVMIVFFSLIACLQLTSSYDDDSNLKQSHGDTVKSSKTGRIVLHQMKRTKGQIDEIKLHEISPSDVEDVIMTEYMETEPLANHIQTKHADIQSKYGYMFSGKSKNRKKKKGKWDKKKSCDNKPMECRAFTLSRLGTVAGLYTSYLGQALELATDYVFNDVEDVALFSNRARGGFCPNFDIEFAVEYDELNTSSSIGRMRYEECEVHLVYDHLLEMSGFDSFAPYVTDILIPKGIFYIDAHGSPFISQFDQINVNPMTNQEVSSIELGMNCFDIVFFSKENARWLCVANVMGSNLSLMRDQSTGQVYVASDDELNPQSYVDDVATTWYTGTSLCGDVRFALTGHYVDDGFGYMRFVRSKLSLKYPYFRDTEIFGIVELPSVDAPTSVYIYAAPNTDRVYACANNILWRFDNAFTREAPFVADYAYTLCENDDCTCARITAFESCPNEVYVLTTDSRLWYSSNLAVDFALVPNSHVFTGTSSALIGLAVPACLE